SVVRPAAAPKLLMSLADRLRALRAIGPSATVVQRFDLDFARVSAEDFVRRFLVEILDAQKLLVGHDLNYGHGRAGSVDTLVEAGSRFGFAVEVIGPVEVDGVAAHSSVVRKAIAAGDVALACKLLGRPHMVRGRVVHGAGRGSGLGFATANIEANIETVPSDGVYVTTAIVDGKEIDGVTSIGSTPTFNGTERVIESHLFAELGDLYGKSIGLRFFERVRDQKKFANSDELVAQIARDVETARAVLAERHTS
ncbi:MAG: riboflavin kinase/FMN adenylyltransferase, partial [Candidatus Binatia bacterium]